MYNNQEITNHSGKNSIIKCITFGLSKLVETITIPTTVRSQAYYEQASCAQEEMRKDNISRKERKFWTKQHDKAINGLEDVHRTNCETTVSLAIATITAFVIGSALFNNKK